MIGTELKDKVILLIDHKTEKEDWLRPVLIGYEAIPVGDYFSPNHKSLNSLISRTIAVAAIFHVMSFSDLQHVQSLSEENKRKVIARVRPMPDTALTDFHLALQAANINMFESTTCDLEERLYACLVKAVVRSK
jgi:hypothetical protein